MRLRTPAIVLAVCLLPLSGCVAAVAAAGAGAGAYAIFEGDIEREFDANISTVWSAVRQASGELGLEVTNDRLDGLEATMTAQRTDGQIVRIKAEGKGTVSTRLKVRVGVSDKSKSRTILRRIEMGMPPGTPPSRDV
ncbi:MAG: DUF3568 family protein [Planctomycetota bacterium]